MSRPSSVNSDSSDDSFKSFPPTPPRPPLDDDRRISSIPENLSSLDTQLDLSTNFTETETTTGTQSSSVFPLSHLRPPPRDERRISSIPDTQLDLSTNYSESTSGTISSSASTHQRPVTAGDVAADRISSSASTDQRPLITEDAALDMTFASVATKQRPLTAEEVAAEAGMTSLPLRIPPKSARRYAKYPISVPAPPPFLDRDAAGVPRPTKVLPSPSAASSEMANLAAKEGWTSGHEPERGFRCLGMLGINNREWSSDRKRTCRFLALVIGVLLLLIGLAVGLGVGLTRKGSNDNAASSSSSSNPPSSSTPAFPIGSYTFNTTFQKQQADCTSNSATWRCFPYSIGASATFSWIIAEDPDHQGLYTISASDNPFAPNFKNLSLSLEGSSTAEERFEFSFSMNKTVVPSAPLSREATNAQCTFENTRFQGTLWTRQHNGVGIATPKDGGVKFSPWPGDVEVVQTAAAKSGQPTCVDANGDALATIRAGTGDCMCEYASFNA